MKLNLKVKPMKTGIRLSANLSLLIFLTFNTLLFSCTEEDPEPVQEDLEEDLDMDGVADSLVLVYQGDFVSNVHTTSGMLKVYENENGDRVLRFENFKTDNGPDLNVYLNASTSPNGFIDLGDLKSISGSFNYNLPANIDFDDKKFVIIWCVDFSVLFGHAELTKVENE